MQSQSSKKKNQSDLQKPFLDYDIEQNNLEQKDKQKIQSHMNIVCQGPLNQNLESEFKTMVSDDSTKSQVQVEEEVQSQVEDFNNIQNQDRELVQNIESSQIQEILLAKKQSEALFHNDKIPCFWKFVIPILLISNFCMFAFDSDDGADVHLDLTQKGVKLPSYNISKFSLLQSIKDMWNGKAYSLSILVTIWSGIWPYAKLFLLLIVWMLNTNYISFKVRERIMIAMDSLGKWSLIDSYMLIMQLVAFNLHIGKPEKLQIIVQVAPGPSFYVFLFATLFSLIITHLILYFHRLTKQKTFVNEILPKPLLFTTQNKKWLNYTVLISLAISAAFLFYGAILNSFNFTFYGLAGYLIQPNQSTDYSIITLGQQLPYKTADPNSFMIRMIQVIYFTFGLAVPFMFLSSLAIIWVVPLKVGFQRKLFQWIEIMNAWANMEVIAICILACISEIPTFTYYMIGRYCGPLNEWLALLDSYGIIDLDGHDLCFQVSCSFLPGFYVFICSAIIYIISSFITIRICQNQLNKRIEEACNEKQETNQIINQEQNIQNLEQENNQEQFYSFYQENIENIQPEKSEPIFQNNQQ